MLTLMSLPGIDSGLLTEIFERRAFNKLRGRYVLFEMKDSTLDCGLVKKGGEFHGRAIVLEDAQTGNQESIMVDSIKSVKGIFENKDAALKGLLNVTRAKQVEENIIGIVTTSEAFFNKCEEIQNQFSSVRILSNSPGLILPTERTSTEFRRKYFETIFRRLESGKSNYNLEYLFDQKKCVEILAGYQRDGRVSLLEEARENLRQCLRYPNLDIRFGDTSPLAGMVIGGGRVACIGFKETQTAKITEGVIVYAPELLQVFEHQFRALFDPASKLEEDFIERPITLASAN